MAKTDPIPRSDSLFAAQLRTFKLAIDPYAATVGVTPAQVASQAADSDYFNYILRGQSGMLGGAKAWTNYKDSLRRGSGGGATPPAPPVFPDPPPSVPLGVETRFRALIRQIKVHANYNPSIGQALGIEGAESTGPDLVTIQPSLVLSIIGGVVQVGWGWDGNAAYLDMIELRVDRDDGRGSVFLANDTTPGYTDSTPFPAKPTKWTYTAIFWLNDRAVGQWSNPGSVTVGG